METISSRYGLALYSIALDNNQVVEMQEEIKQISSIFKENADFIMILGSSLSH